MTTNLMPMCGYCVHLHTKPGSRRALIPWRCDAFPDGIPAAIIGNEADHRQSVEGDHGIHFEPESARGAAYAAMIFDGGPVPRRAEGREERHA
jgi:hypothetical protein